MLSIIQSVIREPEEYEPIFYNSVEDAELIIIDSKWDKIRQNKIKDLASKTRFKRVVYAPAKPSNGLRYDFLSAQNTGLAYAEEEMCMLIGGRNELHPQFFLRLRETIDNFGYNVAIRPIELEANNGDTKWNTYVKYPERYIFLPAPPLSNYGLRAILPIITCGFIIMSRNNWYHLNGLDERYDVGCKWWDNELLDRLYTFEFHVFVDQKLLIYRYPHVSAQPPDHDAECKKIYDDNKIIYPNIDDFKGNIKAPNNFSLEKLHEEYKEKKSLYIVYP